MTVLAAGGAGFDLVLLGVLAGAALLLVLAYRLRLPYPILLVVGGGALGFLRSRPASGSAGALRRS